MIDDAVIKDRTAYIAKYKTFVWIWDKMVGPVSGSVQDALLGGREKELHLGILPLTSELWQGICGIYCSISTTFHTWINSLKASVCIFTSVQPMIGSIRKSQSISAVNQAYELKKN